MVVYSSNKRKYIKRILNSITRQHFIKWLIASSSLNDYSFNLSEAIYQMGQFKMEQIKQYIFEKAFFNHNLWFIYEEIKDFKEIVELLSYLSPKACYYPEIVLLDILRSSREIRIINTDIPGIYRIYPSNYKVPTSREDILRAIKVFVRSYVLLVFDIEKRPIKLSELYKLFIQENKPYSYVREYNLIRFLEKRKGYNMREILMLLDDNNLYTPEEIFINIIRQDYNHFFRMIDDYYGSKDWKEAERIRAYIKLYDIYSHGENPRKAIKIGDIIIKNLNKSNLDEGQKVRLTRIILRNKERLNYEF